MSSRSVALALIAFPFATASWAATATDTMQVQIVIQSTCTVSANDLNFANTGALTADVDQTATLAVQCSSTTPYALRLDGGLYGDGTAAGRQMRSGATDIDYDLYTDVSRTQLWGNDGASDVEGTGNGASQTITVYGRVPAQTTPAPGTYVDTITVTIEY